MRWTLRRSTALRHRVLQLAGHGQHALAPNYACHPTTKAAACISKATCKPTLVTVARTSRNEALNEPEDEKESHDA
jgi:hypothetical protein